MKNTMKNKKILTYSLCAALLLCSGAVSGSLVKAANASKTAVNKRATWGATIDQTSKSTAKNSNGSMAVYKTTLNGSDKTKFVFNVMDYGKKSSRCAYAYLSKGGEVKTYPVTSKKADFGSRLELKAKGAASVGSFVTETVDGKFAAGITLG